MCSYIIKFDVTKTAEATKHVPPALYSFVPSMSSFSTIEGENTTWVTKFMWGNNA